METGAITQYIDVAQIVLYLFWVFFAGLIYYLMRENHREGYPLDPGRENGPTVKGWPVPEPKIFLLADGRSVQIPDPNRLADIYHGQPAHGWGAAPLEPIGDPLIAGVGPGAWAQRADMPDLTPHGDAKIVPLRVATDHSVARQDVDPRGLDVFGADGLKAGIVRDLWVDRMEMMFRYLEVELPGGHGVLLPATFSRIRRSGVSVNAILASQFGNVPVTKSSVQITLLDEEKITAYFGAGTLYATAERQEPLL